MTDNPTADAPLPSAAMTSLEEAHRRVLEMGFPPVTLAVNTARAFGHRLAKPVIARGNQPSRPVALVDGLAVLQRDVQRKGLGVEAGEPETAREEQQAPDLPPLPPALEEGQAESFLSDTQLAAAEAEAAVQTPRARQDDKTGHYVMRLAGDDESAEGDDWSEEQAEAQAADGSDAESALAELSEAQASVELTLRSRPQTSRREDALAPGQAVAVPVGAEVPRGADLLLPLDELAGDPEPYSFDYAGTTPEPEQRRGRRPERPRRPARGREGDAAGESEEPAPAPVVLAEPEQTWNLPLRFSTGRVALPISRSRLPRRLIPIGAWARNREVLLPERVLLRATEMALLEACGVGEVEIYRRPVVGVACLGGPFPMAGQAQDGRRPGADPLSVLVQYLCKAAQVAALPFGFAPQRFRALRGAVERWAQQVDILLLVGGSHHGPRCLGQDVLASFGQLVISGVDLEPAGSLSAGYAGRTPCFVVPGSLPDVLAAFVLFARPLAHKYFMPQHFLGELPVVLDRGSQINFERTMAVPIRYSYDRQFGCFRSGYAGQRGEPWLDNMRGHALAVFEAGRSYADGETIAALTY